MNMNLRELYLADNKLNGLQDSAQLGNLLKFNYNIQILDLRNNHILDSGERAQRFTNRGTKGRPHVHLYSLLFWAANTTLLRYLYESTNQNIPSAQIRIYSPKAQASKGNMRMYFWEYWRYTSPPLSHRSGLRLWGP